MHGKFEIPKFLSKDSRQLLIGILNTDPNKRMTINDIRKSDFYLKNVTSPEPQFELNVSIDEDVVAKLS